MRYKVVKKLFDKLTYQKCFSDVLDLPKMTGCWITLINSFSQSSYGFISYQVAMHLPKPWNYCPYNTVL